MSEADELKSYLPQYLLDSNILNQVFNSIGPELDKFNVSKDDLYAQCFIETATWGLDLWDEFAGTQTRQLDIDERRNIIKVKLMTRPPCTRATLLSILKTLTDDAEINENYANYTFDVILKTKNTFGSKLNYIMEQIELIKPAHLDYRTIIDYLTDLIIKVNFTKYESGLFSYCGTLKTTNVLYSSTEGRGYSDLFIDKVNKYFSNIFIHVSPKVYPNGSNGKRLVELVKDVKNEYFSNKFRVLSENTYVSLTDGKYYKELIKDMKEYYYSNVLELASESTYTVCNTAGTSKDENITDKYKKYFSISLPQCSINTYCGGGVYS